MFNTVSCTVTCPATVTCSGPSPEMVCFIKFPLARLVRAQAKSRTGTWGDVEIQQRAPVLGSTVLVAERSHREACWTCSRCEIWCFSFFFFVFLLEGVLCTSVRDRSEDTLHTSYNRVRHTDGRRVGKAQSARV